MSYNSESGCFLHFCSSCGWLVRHCMIKVFLWTCWWVSFHNYVIFMDIMHSAQRKQRRIQPPATSVYLLWSCSFTVNSSISLASWSRMREWNKQKHHRILEKIEKKIFLIQAGRKDSEMEEIASQSDPNELETVIVFIHEIITKHKQTGQGQSERFCFSPSS